MSKSKDTIRVKVLKNQEEEDLIKFINDLPTKFGLPLIQFLSNLPYVKINSEEVNGTDKGKS
jgi:predicted methyltransferase